MPKIDGLTVAEYDDFEPAPVVVDDNILRTSWRHQELVVDRLAGAHFDRVDFNSGFDPDQFSQRHFDLYSRLQMQMWRIAFDEVREWRAVYRAIRVLRANGVPKNKIFCYVLAGNEPFAHCLWRAMKVVEWGGEPRIQMMKPLNWLGSRRDVWINPKLDWDRETSINFPRYWYSYAWRRLAWEQWSSDGFEYRGAFTRTETHSKVRDTAARAASRWVDSGYLYGAGATEAGAIE